jgi:hypothetical protein
MMRVAIGPSQRALKQVRCVLLRLARNMARLGIVTVDLHSHTFDEARMVKWAYHAYVKGHERRYWSNLL